MLENSSAPCLTLFDTKVKFLLYAYDLFLLSATLEGLQQDLYILKQYCCLRALSLNQSKFSIMVFLSKADKNTHLYIYIGMSLSSTESFNLALQMLKIKYTEPLIQ